VGIRLADTGQIRGPAGSYVLRITRRATQLTTDRRGVSVETPGDIPHAKALDSVHRDVLAFIEREVATRASVAVWWFHTSTMAEPITTRRYRRAQGLGGFFDIAAGSDLVPEFDRERRGGSRWLIATSHCYFPHFEGSCNEPSKPSCWTLHSPPAKSALPPRNTPCRRGTRPRPRSRPIMAVCRSGDRMDQMQFQFGVIVPACQQIREVVLNHRRQLLRSMTTSWRSIPESS